MTRDPLDDLGPLDLGLAALLGHLTSRPSADELSGEYATLTMFRAVRAASAAEGGAAGRGAVGTVTLVPPAPSRPPAQPGGRRRRRQSRVRVGGWLAAGATVVAVGGGFAVAGYAEVLPAPLQQVAHQILGFAGVPNPPRGSRTPAVPVSSGHSATGPGGSSSPSPGSSGSSGSPGSGSPSPHRHPSGSPRPRRSGSPSPRLPTLTISVTLVPPQQGHGPDVLLVSVPKASRGDLVMLDELVGGRWTVLLTHPLREGGQTTFTLPARKISVTYRVVLSATAKHRQSVSALVQVAPHQNKGGGGGGKGQGGG